MNFDRSSLDRPPLRARLLGPTEIALGDRLLTRRDWPGRAPRALLLLLLGAPGHRLPRDQVLDTLWPESDPAASLNSLYKALHAARRVLEPGLRTAKDSGYLQVGGDAVWLAPAPTTWVDVDAFETATRQASSLADPERRAALRDALDLYRGDFLADEPYLDWPIPRREALSRLREEAALALAALDLAAGEPLASVPTLDQVITADPTNETAHQALMRAYAAAGERERALRQFDRCRTTLREELDADPAPATVALAAAIDKLASTSVAAPGIAGPRPFDNLPASPTLLIGRQREIEAVQDLLVRDDVRLVTLTGPGGVGKTRLAIEAAAGVKAEIAHGVAFVALAPLRDPALVVPTIAQTFGLKDQANRSADELVREYLRDREVLLVLDNVEHVLAAAPAIADLLAACPHLTVLATSREALFLRGEREVTVGPLSAPNLDRLPALAALARYESVALFLQTVRAYRPDLVLDAERARLIAEVCVRLDGLPLAIELAAARLRRLTIEALHAQLGRRLDLLTGGPRDLPERQRTLRDTIAWSHDLLAPDEQVVFRRLAVFTGGADLEAIEAVAGVGSRHVVTELAEKSLVRLDGPDAAVRLTMLETIREYSLEQLQERGEVEQVSAHHAAHFAKLVERAEKPLQGPDQVAWTERLDADYENVRAALGWLIERADAAAARAMAARLWRYWRTRGLLREGRDALDAALALPGEACAPDRAAAVDAHGRIAWEFGDLDLAEREFQEAIDCWRRLGDRLNQAISLNFLALVAAQRGDLERSVRLDSEALAIHRDLANPRGVASSLSGLAIVAYHQGRFDESDAYLAEAERAVAASGDLLQKYSVLNNRSSLAFRRGDLAAARVAVEESLTISRRLGTNIQTAFGLVNLGLMLLHDQFDEPVAALQHARDALKLADPLDAPGIVGGAWHIIGCVELKRGQLPAAAAAFDAALTYLVRAGEAAATIDTIEGIATLAGRGGQPALAARLGGAMAAQRAVVGHAVAPSERAAYERWLAEIRADLDDGTYATESERGRTLPIDDAITEAGTLCRRLALAAPPA